MDDGQRIHRVVLQRPQQTQDADTGALTTTWATVTGIWAAIEYLSARELIAAQAEQSEVVARIVIPWRKGVTSEMRLLYGETVFEITGVLPDKASGREYLTLPCSEGTSDGQ